MTYHRILCAGCGERISVKKYAGVTLSKEGVDQHWCNDLECMAKLSDRLEGNHKEDSDE